MNNYIEYFTNYVYKNYDMNNQFISLKYYHSLRVAWLMSLLASKLNMCDEDIVFAFKLGLCHDLGRFYEVARIGRFDNIGFDHGAYSNKILYNDLFINYMDISEHVLFRKAIYNHNKKDINNIVNNRELVFTNLLRDADKIDILRIRSNKDILNFDSLPDTKVLSNYMSNQTINLKDIKGMVDSTILYLSFFKDLYYRVSHDVVINHGYLDDFLKIVQVSESNQELFDNLINKIYEERGKVYVR